MYTVGVDIGGMSIKVGIVDKDGKIVKQSRFVTSRDASFDMDKIAEHINSLLKDLSLTVADLDGIGLGCPGAVSAKTGEIAYLPNLGWQNVPVREMLKKHFDLPIEVGNDASVATLGEVLYGAAKGVEIAAMFTLGTGVGGGMVINGKLFDGGWSRGGELGHTTLFMDGEQCSCGRRGCVECYTSATALIKQTKNAMLINKESKMWEYVNGDLDKVDGRTAFECSKQGDKTANAVVDRYVSYLAESLLNMFNIFRPEAFIIGGGISGQGEYLTNKLKDYCEKFDYGYKDAPKTKILTATLGNDAGIIGAAALLRQ